MTDSSGGPSDKDLSEIENTAAENIAAQPVLGVDITLDDLLKGQIKKDEYDIDPKKLRQIILGTVGVLLLVIVLGVYACQPKKGSMAYGICSAFLELNTPYPHTLRFTGIEGSRTAVRIYFTNIDPFGEFKQEMIECTFGPDEVMGMKLTQVLRNRRAVDAAMVRKFNISLPTIMASDPYLVMPPDWENPLVPK